MLRAQTGPTYVFYNHAKVSLDLDSLAKSNEISGRATHVVTVAN